jgi:hypothetical protein
MYGKWEMHKKFRLVNLNEKSTYETLAWNANIIAKIRCEGVDWIKQFQDMTQLWTCEHDSELWVP